MKFRNAVCAEECGGPFNRIAACHENDPFVPRQPCQFFRQPEHIRHNGLDFRFVQSLDQFRRKSFLQSRNPYPAALAATAAEIKAQTLYFAARDSRFEASRWPVRTQMAGITVMKWRQKCVATRASMTAAVSMKPSSRNSVETPQALPAQKRNNDSFRESAPLSAIQIPGEVKHAAVVGSRITPE